MRFLNFLKTMKLKHLLFTALALFGVVNSVCAKEDVTSKLNDAALANESNWNLASNGGNHTGATNGYHESWHNTFSLTQTVSGLDAGYYRLSIQAAVENNFSNTISLTATSGSNTSVAAHPVYTTNGSYSDMAAWWKADADALGNANLNRIYTTVKVEEGQDLVCRFEQTANNQWMVYGQFKLEKLTNAEGENAQAFEAVYNNKTELQNIASGRFKQRFESYDDHKEVDGERLTKTISGLPNGKYRITINGSASYTSGRGFEGATGDNLVVFFANDKTTNVPVADRTNVGNGEFGDYTVEGALVTDGNLTFGYRRLALGANWFTASVKSIEYLGVDLSDYEEPFNTALANAKAVNQEAKMNADVLSALQTAISNNDVEFSTFTKAAAVEDAINALKTATDNANASIGIYAAVTAKYNTLDAAGKAAFEATTTGEKYVANTLVNEDCAADLATAAKAQTTEGADMTLAIVNPTVDGQTGWTCEKPKGGNGPLLGGTAFEYWGGNANPRSEASFDYYQIINGLAPGVYKVSAEMSNSLNGEAGATFNLSCGVYGNNTIAYVTTEGDTRNRYTATVTVTNGTLRLGVKSDKTMGARWFTADNFTLTFVNAISLDDYRNNVASLLTQANAITGKQQASLATALADAISATDGYESETDIEKLNGMIDGLTDAIANSNASVAAYAALNTVLTNNIYIDRSAAFGTEFTYRTEAQTMYDEATAATADVNAKASGMQLQYRNYVKGIAENYTIVEGVKEARDAEAWVFTTDPTNKGNYNNTVNNDIAANAMRENWKGSAMDGDMKQTVSVPNGKYFLRMVSFTRNSPNANDYIYIKSGENTETSVTFGTGDNAFVNITNPIEVTNGEVEIGLHIGSGADWAAIGGVVLYKYAVSVTIGKYGYATYVTPYNMDFTDSKITAYTVSSNIENDIVTITPVDGQKVPAGTALVLKGQSDDINVITEAVAPVATDLTYSNEAITDDTKEANKTYYYLGVENETVVFRPLAAGGTLAARKCFFTVSAGAGAKPVRIVTEGENATDAGVVEATPAVVKNGKFATPNGIVIVKNGVASTLGGILK